MPESALGAPTFSASPSVREDIQSQLRAGTLVRASGRAWIHTASGHHRCAACGQMIRARQPECEIEDRVVLHAHVVCFKLWVEQSRALDAGHVPAVEARREHPRSTPLARVAAIIGAWSRALGLVAALCGVLVAAPGGRAEATAVLPNLTGEPSLDGIGGLLDVLFGLTNLVRMDDAVDQLWGNTELAHVRIVAKYSAYQETLGYQSGEQGGVFVPLLTVADDGAVTRDEVTFSAADSGSDFRWALLPTGPGAVTRPWSARADDNADLRDHMVTWQVTGADGHADNILGSFVIGFEDLSGLGDADYNDMVAQIWGVTDAPLQSLPAPASLALLVAAAGLLGWRRRRAE